MVVIAECSVFIANNAMAFAWLNGSSDADARPAYNRSFYLYGTFDVMDSAGVWLPNLTLPQRLAAGAPVNMSVVGCNLYSYDSFFHVNTTTRLAVREEVANMSTSAYWESYGPLAAVKAEELDILDLVRKLICSSAVEVIVMPMV